MCQAVLKVETWLAVCIFKAYCLHLKLIGKVMKILIRLKQCSENCIRRNTQGVQLLPGLSPCTDTSGALGAPHFELLVLVLPFD